MLPVIRFYCVALPFTGHHLGFDYLQAIADAGFPVRACPIGPMFPSGAWTKLVHLFEGNMDPEASFVNVVCAPAGMPLGSKIGREQAGSSTPPTAGVSRQKPNDEIVYVPSTVFAGLYTEGVKNVALTMARPKPVGMDLEALKRYDLICAPTAEDVVELDAHDLRATHRPPDAVSMRQALEALGDRAL